MGFSVLDVWDWVRAVNAVTWASIPLLFGCDSLTPRQPPKETHKLARAVIAAVPAYNRTLLENPTTTIHAMTDEQKAAISAAVTASKKFVGVLDGLRVSSILNPSAAQ